MFFDILDKNRQKLLPYLDVFKSDFYLAGGTALALQFGHRDSEDFDFFAEKSFDTLILFEKLRKVFIGYKIIKIQDEENTLSVILNDEIKLSFFKYEYPLMKDLVSVQYLNLASLEDIACMKLTAITHRSTIRDYIDLYYLLKKFSLSELILLVDKKFKGTLDRNFILKSLIYFDDFNNDHIIHAMRFCHHKEVTFSKIKSFLEQCVYKFNR